MRCCRLAGPSRYNLKPLSWLLALANDQRATCVVGPSFGGVFRSGIVIPAVPRLKERHVITWLHLDCPGIVLLLGIPKDKPEGSAKAFDGEGSHFDSIIRDVAEFSEPSVMNFAA